MKVIFVLILLSLPLASFAENISTETSHNSSSFDSASSDGGEVLLNILLIALKYTFVSLYALPHNFIDSGFDILATFPHYPYHRFSNKQGYLDLNEPLEGTNLFSLHSSAETKFYKNDLTSLSTHVNLYSFFRVDLLNDYTYFDSDPLKDESDFLAFGSSNITYRFAQNEFIQMRSGLGINYIVKDHQSKFRANYLYAIDIYPIKPLFLSARLDLGKMGNSGYARLRTITGFVYKRLEINAGLELTKIGGKSLNGIILGMKFTF